MNQQEFGQHCSDLGDLETPENPLGQLRRSGKSSWTNHKGPASFIREGIVGKWGNGRLQGEFYVGDVSEVDRVGLQWSSDYAYAAPRTKRSVYSPLNFPLTRRCIHGAKFTPAQLTLPLICPSCFSSWRINLDKPRRLRDADTDLMALISKESGWTNFDLHWSSSTNLKASNFSISSLSFRSTVACSSSLQSSSNGESVPLKT